MKARVGRGAVLALALGLALGVATAPALAADPPAGGPVASGCSYLDDGSVIDVLVVYTTEARDTNSTNDIFANIQAHVSTMNLCLDNSRAFPRIEVVHIQELVYDDPNDNILSIQRLLDPSDGYLDEVHSLRDFYRADLVVMFAHCPNCGGTAACNTGDQYIRTESGGFAILSSDWPAVEPLGMAHELAHTMGCGHNRDAENIGPGQPINCRYYPYSYGYDFQGDSGRWHSTIMSYGPTRCGGTLAGSPCSLYDDNCPPGSPCAHLPPQKILHYSNPLVLYDGQPTGVPIGQPNAADNVSTIDNGAFVVGNFRQRLGNIWVDFAHLGIEQGCFELPYNTFGEGVTAVPDGGTLIFKAGTTQATGTIQGTKSFRMKAFGGVVRIGG